MKSSYYSDASRPLPRPVKIILALILGVMFLMWLYGQYISMFYLKQYEKYYVINKTTAVYAEKRVDSKRLGFLKLWQSVMVPRKRSGDWAEVDKPMHGFIQFKELGTLQQMNAVRDSKGLNPKSSMF